MTATKRTKRMAPGLHRPARVRGFTLVEVLIATALLGFALVVMFGLHNQSVRSNVMARKVTDCTYLSQSKLEELLAAEWTTSAGRSGDLGDGTSGAVTTYDSLYQPNGGSDPTAVNAIWEYYGSESVGQPAATYYVTWEVEDNSDNGEWIQLWVRCSWDDRQFLGQGVSKRHAMTISSYKFVDDGIASSGGSGGTGSGGSGSGGTGSGGSGTGGTGSGTGGTGSGTGGSGGGDDTGGGGGDDTGFGGDDTGFEVGTEEETEREVK